MNWKSRSEIKFEIGEFYEIGYREDCYRDDSKNQFYHQGFAKYTDSGFLDENGYHIKPTPNRLIHIKKTKYEQ